MRECGLPTPANCIIRRPEDLPNAAKQVQHFSYLWLPCDPLPCVPAALCPAALLQAEVACAPSQRQLRHRCVAQVGFPAVIKPTSGAASLGVIRVDNEPDLHRCVLCSHCRAVLLCVSAATARLSLRLPSPDSWIKRLASLLESDAEQH